MRRLLLIFCLMICSSQAPLKAKALKGRADTWLLYITDNFDTQSVLEVYESKSCDDVSGLEPIYIAYGKERENIQCNEGRCCIERVIRNGEVIVERIIEENGKPSVTKEYKTGDTLLQSLGIDAQYQKENWKVVIDVDFRYHHLGERTLYGSKKYRLHAMDLYLEAQKNFNKNAFRFRTGRQSLVNGVLIDGLRSDWLLDPEGNKSWGIFAGLSPDPRTKLPSVTRFGFGSHFHFVPEFSTKTRTKLLIDATLFGETYEWKMNRFALFTRSHFAPIPSLSLFHYSTLELPVPGEDLSLKSSYFSFRFFYRPHRKWTLSGGVSQFRMNRYLQQESVRWLTDDGSLQHERVGQSLDRSDRYRFDLNLSYRPTALFQPYISGRYERRVIDGNKKFLNHHPNHPDDGSLPDENLSLLNRKNAYGGNIGLRLYPFEYWETDSRFGYNRRFQSTGYDLLQEIRWAPNMKWSAETYFQVLWSKRNIYSSLPDGTALKLKTTDYYAGLGTTYRFRSGTFAQIRYDFAYEEDHSIETNILIHSFLFRLDYRF